MIKSASEAQLTAAIWHEIQVQNKEIPVQLLGNIRKTFSNSFFFLISFNDISVLVVHLEEVQH